jgi:transcriptional regulator with XRE-family HTH domain
VRRVDVLSMNLNPSEQQNQEIPDGQKTLGTVVKEARDGTRKTQRDLAAAIGVKASHIAYIENGRRRPSISLVNRLSEALGISAKELLVLAHPEAKQIIESERASGGKADSAWQRFTANKALIKGHGITPAELKLLKQVSMLSHVAHPGHAASGDGALIARPN